MLYTIGGNYGITNEQALEEVTGPEAEHLLDYVTGQERGALYVLMRGHGLSA